MKARQTKVIKSVLTLVLLLLLSLSGKAANQQENVPLGVDIAVLSENEPRIPISSLPCRITNSGSYYLTKDLQTTMPDQNAIEIVADSVTIDLMGYSLIGTDSGNGCGIFMNGRKNVEIRNGTVWNFGGDGVYEAKYPTETDLNYGAGHRVISVRAISNVGAGIRLSGFGHLVRDCSALSNKNDGIYVEHGCIVTDNISSLNGDDGIELGSGCTVIGNTVIYNSSYGIWSWDGCTVYDNTLYGNAYGIYAEGIGSLIKGNTLRNNDLSNIFVKGTDNVIEGNLVTGSEYGIYFETSDNFYANNRASGNKTNYSGPGKPTGTGDGGGNVAF